ncbi:MAG: hypothetical protein R2940_10975 [Syntrophotaleaceae bacterium]
MKQPIDYSLPRPAIKDFPLIHISLIQDAADGLGERRDRSSRTGIALKTHIEGKENFFQFASNTVATYTQPFCI